MLIRLPLAVLLAGASAAWGQQVISAHSGVIHLVEGQVTLDGKSIAPKFAEFPDVKNGQVLAAEDGRAEVLLTPGVILRIGENSSFKMISNSRSDTRLQILTGSAIIEADELLPTNAITLVDGDVHMSLTKKGLYRVDADPGKLRVYEGEALVTEGDQTLTARKGRQVLLGTILDMNAFDTKDVDALMRWASRRAEYLSQANVSAARSASSMGYLGSNGGYGSSLGSWAYNPWYGMFTYLPYSGYGYSTFGYGYYSPMTIGYYTPTSGTHGSAFPVASTPTSPHYNSGTGNYGMTPRGSYSAGGVPATNTGSGGFAGGGSPANSIGGGAVSSGAAAHAGGGSAGGMGGGARGK